MSTGRYRWLLVGVCVVTACGALLGSLTGAAYAASPSFGTFGALRGAADTSLLVGAPGASSSTSQASPNPSLVGTWDVSSYCSGSPCSDTLDISIGGQPSDPYCSADVYCITDPSGFYGKDVSVTPNGGGSWFWTCTGCTPGYGEDINVTFKGNTFTGTAATEPGGDTVPYDGTCENCTSAPTYTLSGNIELTCGCGPITGVNVAISGPDSTAATTNAKGHYSATVSTAGTYTVTPSKSGYKFTPPRSTVTVNDANPNETADFKGCDAGANASELSDTPEAPGATAPANTCKVVLSGKVLWQACASHDHRHCWTKEEPLAGAEVRVTGARGTRTTRTDKAGDYRFTLRTGRYAVAAVPYGSDIVDPARQHVDLRTSRSGVNFLECWQGDGRPSADCKLVQVHGMTVDIVGGPFGGVTVFGKGESTTSDASGHFVLFVQHGPQEIDGEWSPPHTEGFPSYDYTESSQQPGGSTKVDASDSVPGVFVTIHPTLWMAEYTTDTNRRELVQLNGLPLHYAYELYAEANEGREPGCSVGIADRFSSGTARAASFPWVPKHPFCPEHYLTHLFSYDRSSGKEDHILGPDGNPVVGWFSGSG